MSRSKYGFVGRRTNNQVDIFAHIHQGFATSSHVFTTSVGKIDIFTQVVDFQMTFNPHPKNTYFLMVLREKLRELLLFPLHPGFIAR